MGRAHPCRPIFRLRGIRAMQQCAPEGSQECSAAAEDFLSGGRWAHSIGTRAENSSRVISFGRWESSDSTSRGAIHEKVPKGTCRKVQPEESYDRPRRCELSGIRKFWTKSSRRTRDRRARCSRVKENYVFILHIR